MSLNISGPPPKKEPEEEKPLPQFRQDLKLVKAPDDADGSPAYNLYDPVRARYFRLNWAEALVFQLVVPGMTLKELVLELQKRTTLDITEEEMSIFFDDAERHNLLARTRPSEDVERESEFTEMGWFKWIIFHYLYIRIPLFAADNFLSKTIGVVGILASRYAITLYVIIAVTGFLQLINRFDEFINTFTYFFNWEGFLGYAAAIIIVKIFHELGHAYVAKYYGIHVPIIGIALIILWPVLYTDVTDAWKLSSRKQRFAISFAGVAVELVLAGMATWGWVLSSPGIFQSICFLTASVTWISSLLINLNPCMRFDGYYLLSDLWGIDNMQNRSFDVTRWKLRQWLLGLDLPAPEPLTKKRIMGMMIYSIATWIYRITLYISIAVIVYYKFTKVLGITLFIAEIAIFLVWPIIGEIQYLARLRKYIKINVRIVLTCIGGCLFIVWFVVPTPNNKSFTAITIPAMNQNIYIPYDGIIDRVYVKKGDYVAVGEPLFRLVSEPLEAEIRSTALSMNIVEREIVVASLDEKMQPDIAAKQAELRAYKARLGSLMQLKKQLTVRASLTGDIYDWDDQIHAGQAVAKDQVAGKIAELNQIEVVAYVPEEEVQDIHTGQEVVFKVKSSLEKIPGEITSIRPGRDIVLEHKQLASVHKGDLPTTQKKSGAPLRLVESYYVVDVRLDREETKLNIGQLGYVEAEGPWRSRMLRLFSWVQKIFWRESAL